jgi:hypothetical protein
MTVRELITQLIQFPLDATIAVALNQDKMVHIDNSGAIPEGPLGIYQPRLCYIELSEEEV